MSPLCRDKIWILIGKWRHHFSSLLGSDYFVFNIIFNFIYCYSYNGGKSEEIMGDIDSLHESKVFWINLLELHVQ